MVCEYNETCDGYQPGNARCIKGKLSCSKYLGWEESKGVKKEPPFTKTEVYRQEAW